MGYETRRWDHHPPCTCGCNELADECSGPRPNPLGSLRITTPDPNPYHPPQDDPEDAA